MPSSSSPSSPTLTSSSTLPPLSSPLGLESPRSTTCPSIISSSCSGSGPLLTPLDEPDLNKASGEMFIPNSNSNSNSDAEENEDDMTNFVAALHKPIHLHLESLPIPLPTAQSPFSSFSFGSHTTSHATSAVPISNQDISPDDVMLPTEGFSFGTCSSKLFLGTPTAESGPFEYPDTAPAGPSRKPSITSPKKKPLALGETHRRGSIVAHPHSHAQYTNTPSMFPSPPSTRRSSTTSQLTTLPAAGRRPSILHSATVEVIPPSLIPSPSPSPATPGFHSNSNSRRGSIMFHQKPLPAPIPPSLLARRGSVPAAQLFGLPLNEQLKQPRASHSAGPHTTTTAALYRRQSMASESGASTGSGRTIMDISADDGPGIGRRFSTLSAQGRGSTPTSISTKDPLRYSFSHERRPSLPFTHQPFQTSPARVLSRQSISNPSAPATVSPFTRGLPPNRNSFTRSSDGGGGVPPPFGTRHRSLASRSSTSTTSSSISSSSSLNYPSSPTSTSTSRERSNRVRQATSTSMHSSLSLSSSEESNEEEEYELPTPSGSAFSVGAGVGVGSEGKLPSVPTFSDPWASDNAQVSVAIPESNIIEPIALADAEEEEGGEMRGKRKSMMISLETPPLETVAERPMLESVDSSSSERTIKG